MELTYYFYLAVYFVIDQITVFLWVIKPQLLPKPLTSLHPFQSSKGGRFFASVPNDNSLLL